jgi:acetolactate synthase-1/2/3 large subunit
MISPDQPTAPRVTSLERPDGMMVSKPLEDMWPFLSREEFLDNMIVPPLEE